MLLGPGILLRSTAYVHVGIVITGVHHLNRQFDGFLLGENNCMATEIERKFLVLNDGWKSAVIKSKVMRQGYMSSNEKSSVRIRIEGDEANINIKSATLGISRTEFEYAIPLKDANQMLDQLCDKPMIEKTRHYVEYAGFTWEVDLFTGDNQGLVVAELELPTEETFFEKPGWIGEEVSHDPRYYNVCLVSHPYKDWSDQ